MVMNTREEGQELQVEAAKLVDFHSKNIWISLKSNSPIGEIYRSGPSWIL